MTYKKGRGASGAQAGATVGGMIGGPVGAGIGAAVGGLAGFIGSGDKAKKGYSTTGTGPVLPAGPALPPYAQTSNSFEHDDKVMNGRMAKRYY